MKIIDAKQRGVVEVNGGYLNVCLCDRTCDNAASLRTMVEVGYATLLHVRNADGEIVSLTVDMLDQWREEP